MDLEGIPFPLAIWNSCALSKSWLYPAACPELQAAQM